jgi:small subunit ribosomal protein S6
MSATVYEGLFILDSNKYARDPAGVSGEVTGLIERFGGKLMVSRLWDERRLAYPINGQRKGTYWLTYFTLDSVKLTPLTREFEINENILRQLVLKVHPKLVDALIAHAKSGTAPDVVRPGQPLTQPTPEAKVAAVTAAVVEEMDEGEAE